MSSKTLIVFFNLKPGVNESDYLSWAKNSDLPTVNALGSVSSFEVFKELEMFGQDKPAPWDYFEVIHIESQEAFKSDLQCDAMQHIVQQFEGFAENAHFVVTQNIMAK